MQRIYIYWAALYWTTHVKNLLLYSGYSAIRVILQSQSQILQAKTATMSHSGGSLRPPVEDTATNFRFGGAEDTWVYILVEAPFLEYLCW